MSVETHLLHTIRADIDGLPESRREQIEEFARHFRMKLNAGGSFARVALALVSAELAVEFSNETAVPK